MEIRVYVQFAMALDKSAKQASFESVERIEPARLEDPSEGILDVVAELAAASATLGQALPPRTAASLADVVRIMNTYGSYRVPG